MRLLLAIVLLAVHGGDPRSIEERALVTKGDLAADDQSAIVETVVRYAIASARPPCANHGVKEAYCLKVGSGLGVSPLLLKNLADVRPPILPLTACQTAGFVGEFRTATDHIIEVDWLKVISDSVVQARVTAYCGVSEPTVRKRGARWLIAFEEAGWSESCLLPGDCMDPAR